MRIITAPFPLLSPAWDHLWVGMGRWCMFCSLDHIDRVYDTMWASLMLPCPHTSQWLFMGLSHRSRFLFQTLEQMNTIVIPTVLWLFYCFVAIKIVDFGIIIHKSCFGVLVNIYLIVFNLKGEKCYLSTLYFRLSGWHDSPPPLVGRLPPFKAFHRL